MANEPTTCAACGDGVLPYSDGTCPACGETVAKAIEVPFCGSETEAWPGCDSAAFVFPSLEKKRIEADARRQRRATWLRRALGAVVLAVGAVFANAVYELADGVAVPVVLRQSVSVSLCGLVVGPGVLLFFYYSYVYHQALYETDAEFFGRLPKELGSFSKTPWPYWRFPVYACPAVFAAVTSESQKSSSWLNLAIAAAGSLAAAISLSVIRQSFGGRSVFD